MKPGQLATPQPPEVVALSTALGAFDAAVADQAAKDQAAKVATDNKRQRRAILEAAYAALGNLVQNASAGNANFITARGFEVTTPGAPVMMDQVMGLVVTPGDHEGGLDWMCDPQKNAIYLLETSPDVLPRVWTKHETSRKSNGSIAGLPVASRIWLRVAAKGSHNTGGWSDPALVTVT